MNAKPTPKLILIILGAALCRWSDLVSLKTVQNSDTFLGNFDQPYRTARSERRCDWRSSSLFRVEEPYPLQSGDKGGNVMSSNHLYQELSKAKRTTCLVVMPRACKVSQTKSAW
jgi:hypothetical protein